MSVSPSPARFELAIDLMFGLCVRVRCECDLLIRRKWWLLGGQVAGALVITAESPRSGTQADLTICLKHIVVVRCNGLTGA